MDGDDQLLLVYEKGVSPLFGCRVSAVAGASRAEPKQNFMLINLRQYFFCCIIAEQVFMFLYCIRHHVKLSSPPLTLWFEEINLTFVAGI